MLVPLRASPMMNTGRDDFITCEMDSRYRRPSSPWEASRCPVSPIPIDVRSVLLVTRRLGASTSANGSRADPMVERDLSRSSPAFEVESFV